jgi:hypothetical protein
VLAGAIAATASIAFASPALAAPTAAKNAFFIDADCGSRSFQIVVNSANGQGKGVEDKETAVFAPGHIVGTHEVIHPTAFDLTFTFTPVGGEPQSFTQDASRKAMPGSITCELFAQDSDPAGNTFTLTGTVTGWIS